MLTDSQSASAVCASTMAASSAAMPSRTPEEILQDRLVEQLAVDFSLVVPTTRSLPYRFAHCLRRRVRQVSVRGVLSWRRSFRKCLSIVISFEPSLSNKYRLQCVLVELEQPRLRMNELENQKVAVSNELSSALAMVKSVEERDGYRRSMVEHAASNYISQSDATTQYRNKMVGLSKRHEDHFRQHEEHWQK